MTEPHRPSGRTVLIVDDDRDTREMLRLLLQLEGWQVFTAPSAEEGLDELGRSEVQTVVLDNRMPGMSGLQMVERLREMQHPARVVFVTGADDLGGELERLGVRHYLRKPVDPLSLLGILDGDA